MRVVVVVLALLAVAGSAGAQQYGMIELRGGNWGATIGYGQPPQYYVPQQQWGRSCGQQGYDYPPYDHNVRLEQLRREQRINSAYGRLIRAQERELRSLREWQAISSCPDTRSERHYYDWNRRRIAAELCWQHDVMERKEAERELCEAQWY